MRDELMFGHGTCCFRFFPSVYAVIMPMVMINDSALFRSLLLSVYVWPASSYGAAAALGVGLGSSPRIPSLAESRRRGVGRGVAVGAADGRVPMSRSVGYFELSTVGVLILWHVGYTVCGLPPLCVLARLPSCRVPAPYFTGSGPGWATVNAARNDKL